MAELSTTARFLGHALSKDVDTVVNHHMGCAQMVLAPTEVACILLKLTSELACGAMLYALQTKLDERTPEEICDYAQKAINDLITASRPRVLAKYAELAAHQAGG